MRSSKMVADLKMIIHGSMTVLLKTEENGGEPDNHGGQPETAGVERLAEIAEHGRILADGTGSQTDEMEMFNVVRRLGDPRNESVVASSCRPSKGRLVKAGRGPKQLWKCRP